VDLANRDAWLSDAGGKACDRTEEKSFHRNVSGGKKGKISRKSTTERDSFAVKPVTQGRRIAIFPYSVTVAESTAWGAGRTYGTCGAWGIATRLEDSERATPGESCLYADA
jgi:hypothetical protein